MTCASRFSKGICFLFLIIFASVTWAHNEKRSPGCEDNLRSRADARFAGKTLIIDTNVFLNDPQAIYRFPGAKIIISGTVQVEVGDKKTHEHLGRAARQYSRLLGRLADTHDDFASGVDLGNGASLKLDPKNYTQLLADTTYAPNVPDHQTIATALHYTNTLNRNDVILITDDRDMRIKAASLGVQSKPFEYQLTKREVRTEDAVKENYVTYRLTVADFQRFQSSGQLPRPSDLNILPNEFVMFEVDGVEDQSMRLARYHYDWKSPENSALKALADFSHLPIQPKNIEQAMLLDVLMDPEIHMVISESPAGTGKTFLALVAGLLQLADPKNYDSVAVTRALVQIGREVLGAFPGSKAEKLGHWNESVDDTFAALTKARKKMNENEVSEGEPGARRLTRAERREKRRVEEEDRRQESGRFSVNKNKVHLVAFPHLRGRSITDAFLIVDEAQNTSSHEMKTVLTRAGEGTKMVILGDPTQIDSPYLNEDNNGLSVISTLVRGDKTNLKGRSIVAYVRLTEGVRSELAEYIRLLFEQLNANLSR